MAFTRLYLSNQTAGYSPATLRGSWNETASAVTRMLTIDKNGGGEQTSTGLAETDASATFKRLLYRGVSGPLSAQTLTGTVQLLAQFQESNVAANMVAHVHIYVTQGDSDTPRGTLLTDYTDTTEWATVLTGRDFTSAQSIGSLAISAGDRIVVEIGYEAQNTETTSRTGTIRYGTHRPLSSGGAILSDLTDGSTSLTAAGFVDFSDSITEETVPLSITQMVVEMLLGPEDTLSLPTITSTESIFTPSVENETQGLSLPTIASTTSLFTPFIDDGTGQQLELPTISTSLVLFIPEISASSLEGELELPTISSTSQVYSPFVSPEEILLDTNSFVGLTWVELTWVDTSGAQEVYLWSAVDLPDPISYYGGFKEGRLLRFGNVRRALSDDLGQMESVQFSFLISDTDHLVRELLGNDFGKYYLNRMAVVRMIDDESRRNNQIPRTIARGVVRGIKPIAPLTSEVQCEDFLSTKFSTLNLDKQIPQRTITRTDFPDCPSEHIGKGVPIIYGDVLEQQSAHPAPVLAGNSLRGAFFAPTTPNPEVYPPNLWFMGWGNRVEGASINTPSLTNGPDPVTNVTAIAAAGGFINEQDFPPGNTNIPGAEIYFMLVVVDSLGNEGDPHIFSPRDADPSEAPGTVQTVSTYATIVGTNRRVNVNWSWAADAGSGYIVRIYAGFDFFDFIGGGGGHQFKTISYPSTSTYFDRIPPFGQPASSTNISVGASLVNFSITRFYAVSAMMADGETALSGYAFGKSHPYRRPIRIEWQAIAGAISYRVYAKDTVDSDWNRRWTVSNSQAFFEDDMLDTDVTIIDSTDVGASGPVPCIFVGYATASDNSTWHRYLVCGHAVQEIPDIFVDGVKVDPQYYGQYAAVPGTLSYPTYFPNTGFPQYQDINGRRYTFIYGRGDVSAEIANGTRKLTANVRGIEATAHGGGGLISDLFDQYLHACRNWFFQSYQSGVWLQSPTWPIEPSGHIFSKIDESSFGTARSLAQSRLVGGYPGAFIIGANGERLTLRDMISRLNMSADVDSGFNRHSQFMISMVNPDAISIATFTPIDNVLRNSVSIDPRVDLLENIVVYSYQRDWADEKWNVKEVERRDNTSITLYQEERKAQHAELWCIRDSNVAINVAANRLARHSVVPNIVTFSTTLAGLSADLGDVIQLTHYEGLGASGYELRPLRVIRHNVDLNRYSVTIEASDSLHLIVTDPEDPDPTPTFACGSLTSVLIHDFTEADDGAIYPLGGHQDDDDSDWGYPGWFGGASDPLPLAEYPLLVEAVQTGVESGQLVTSYFNPENEQTTAYAVWGHPDINWPNLTQWFSVLSLATPRIAAYVEVVLQFFPSQFDLSLDQVICSIFGLSTTQEARLTAVKQASGDAEVQFVVRWRTSTGTSGDVLAHSEPSSDTLFGATRTIRFEVTPSTPITESTFNVDGIIRLYLDNVLVYSNVAANLLLTTPGGIFTTQAQYYGVGGVGLGGGLNNGLPGGYERIEFGYCIQN